VRIIKCKISYSVAVHWGAETHLKVSLCTSHAMEVEHSQYQLGPSVATVSKDAVVVNHVILWETIRIRVLERIGEQGDSGYGAHNSNIKLYLDSVASQLSTKGL